MDSNTAACSSQINTLRREPKDLMAEPLHLREKAPTFHKRVQRVQAEAREREERFLRILARKRRDSKKEKRASLGRSYSNL